MPDFCQVMGLPYAVTRDQSQRVPKIAAYDEVNLPDGLASLGVILDRTDSSLAELQGVHAELKRAAQDSGNIVQRRGQ
jgi:hypothetical protein